MIATGARLARQGVMAALVPIPIATGRISGEVRLVDSFATLSILAGIGASTDPCSPDYRGTSSASEPIVKHAIDFLQNKRNNVRAYISLHGYGQYWFYPYSYSESPAYPNNIQELVRRVFVYTTDTFHCRKTSPRKLLTL